MKKRQGVMREYINRHNDSMFDFGKYKNQKFRAVYADKGYISFWKQKQARGERISNKVISEFITYATYRDELNRSVIM
jgi:hypothetical protein